MIKNVQEYYQCILDNLTGGLVSVDLDGSKVFVSHGDIFTGGLMRRVLKSRVTSRVMDLLGPRLTWTIAMGARIILSKKRKPYNARAKERFRGYAAGKFDEGFDVVIFAHSHMPDRMETAPPMTSTRISTPMIQP